MALMRLEAWHGLSDGIRTACVMSARSNGGLGTLELLNARILECVHMHNLSDNSPMAMVDLNRLFSRAAKALETNTTECVNTMLRDGRLDGRHISQRLLLTTKEYKTDVLSAGMFETWDEWFAQFQGS